MRKGLLKACVLIVVFILGILGFGQLTNRTNEDLTKDMAEATLPVVSLYIDETEINELHGYAKEMDAIFMRDTITPIKDDRVLPIKINTYDAKVNAISYEIRSMDKERLIADTKVTDYNEEKGQIQANLTIQNLLEKNQEYLMILKLESGKNTIYYYTRIIEGIEGQVNKCVDFALDFHEKTFDPERNQELAAYLEPNASGDNTTLHKVDIHSTLKQVCWADFKGKRLTTPVPSVKEINDSYNIIVLDYLVESAGVNGELEYYNVEEYYRVRYTDDRMYLLNYERTMNQIFRAESSSFYENYIQLGIRNEKVEYASNEKGDIVCFVQEGELWSFNEGNNQLAQVFSFNSNEGIDSRENYGEHDIKIISIDETGSVNFVVYGYMNSGSHEGEVGICVYHYDSVSNTVEEELFIPAAESYQVMKSDLGQLMYENTQGTFFIMFEGTVYEINLTTMKVEEYITGLKEGTFAISKSHKNFAWIDGGDSTNGTAVWVANLDTGERHQIKADAGEFIKPLGFMEEDFVYGAAKDTDVITDLAGNTVFPMYKVMITDGSTLNILKEYQKPDYYVQSVEIYDYIMYLNGIQFNGMAYVEAERDIIRNKEGEGENTVDIHTTATEVKQTQVQISMADMVKQASPKILTPKEVIFDNDREIALEGSGHDKNFYAYAKGDVLYVSDDLTDTITVANEQMGVVIGDRQQYIWKRARKAAQGALDVSVGTEDVQGSSIAKCVSAMLARESINIGVTGLIGQGKTPKEILETTMQNVSVLDLTGCVLDEVLYYVNLGNPVFAMKSNTDAVLIVGYDSSQVIIYDPTTETTEKKPMEETAAMFANAGNIFFGYIK